MEHLCKKHGYHLCGGVIVGGRWRGVWGSGTGVGRAGVFMVTVVTMTLVTADYTDGGSLRGYRSRGERLATGCRTAGRGLTTTRTDLTTTRRRLDDAGGSCTGLRGSLSGDLAGTGRGGVDVRGLISRVGRDGRCVHRLMRIGDGDSSLGVILAGGLAHSLDHRRVGRISIRILGNIICVSLTSGVLCRDNDCRMGDHTGRALDGVTGVVRSCGSCSILVRNGASGIPMDAADTGVGGVHGG